MICRALSNVNKNIIWFRKTGEDINKVYWVFFNDGSLKGYNDDLRIDINNNQFTYNGNIYTLNYNNGSTINGTIYLGSMAVGVFSYTTKITDVENYAEESAGVADSLTQRLSVIKGELWYQINFGLPLLENHASKTVFDTTIIDIISSHPDVQTIEKFESSMQKHTYTFSAKIKTIYGEAISLSNSY